MWQEKTENPLSAQNCLWRRKDPQYVGTVSLAEGQASIDKMPNVKPVLERAGLSSVVKTMLLFLLVRLLTFKAKDRPNIPALLLIHCGVKWRRNLLSRQAI